MAYIGRDLQYGVLDKQSFTADSSTTAFTLDTAVANAKSLLVSVGGVIQEPDVAYTASGTTLTFTSAPTTGDVVYVIYLGKESSVSGANREGITYQTGTGDDTTTPITLTTAPANAQSIMVMLNGVTQVPVTDYTVSGTTLTFTSTVASGVGILVYYLANQAEFGVLNDNSVTNPKIVSMDAAKLTGSLPAGMGTDTTAIDQTIASLGMHVAVADNKASFNLPGVFIDQFEDDSGILTETDVDRNTTNEYVSSVTGGDIDSNDVLLIHSDSTDGNTTFTNSIAGGGAITAFNNVQHSTAITGKFGGTSIKFDGSGDYLSLPASTDWAFGTGDFTIDYWYNQTDNGDRIHMGTTSTGSAGTGMWRTKSSTVLKFGNSVQDAYTGSTTTLQDNRPNWQHIAFTRESGLLRVFINGGLDGTATVTEDFNVSDRPLYIGEAHDGGDLHGYLDEIRISKGVARWTAPFTPPTAPYTLPVASATGTLISTASTAAAATTTASGVMVYENAAGTATLGTDLKIYFSADDGANWTEASSYGTEINFNGSSKKLVKLGKTTGLTSGTQMKLKAEWANQVSGTKETRLHGWAINY